MHTTRRGLIKTAALGTGAMLARRDGESPDFRETDWSPTVSETTSATFAVTDDTFADDVLGSERPVLVDFWATWCGPCKMVAPVLEQIAAENSDALAVAKLDVDTSPDTAQEYRVSGIPTLILFKDGEEVKRVVGAKSKAALLRELADVL